MKKVENAQNVKVVRPPESVAGEGSFCWRRTERFACSFWGSLIFSEHKAYSVQCRDISVQGASIFSPVHLSCHSHATLKFAVKNNASFILTGAVCWCKKVRDGWNVGIKFDRVLPFELKKLLGPGLRCSEYVAVL